MAIPGDFQIVIKVEARFDSAVYRLSCNLDGGAPSDSLEVSISAPVAFAMRGVGSHFDPYSLLPLIEENFRPVLDVAKKIGERAYKFPRRMQWMESIPLFVMADSSREAEGWAGMLRTYLKVNQAGLPFPIEVVISGDSVEVRPFPELPLRVAVCGKEPLLDSMAARLTGEHEYFSDPAVRQHILCIEPGIQEKWQPGMGEIVISTKVSLRNGPFSLFKRQSSPPRLLILLVDPARTVRPLARWGEDIAVLVIPTYHEEDAYQKVHAALLEIVHDRALHDVVHLLRANYYQGEVSDIASRRVSYEQYRLPQLFANAHSNQALRLSRVVLPQISRIHSPLMALGTGPRIRTFLSRASAQIDGPLDSDWENIFGGLHKISAEAEVQRQNIVSYSRESSGLMPMAKMVSFTNRALGDMNSLARNAALLLEDQATAEAFEKTQSRQVDAYLTHQDSVGSWEPVSPYEPLAPAAGVNLWAQIGQTAPGSLVVGVVPALDPLLPPLPGEQTHLLDFVLFPRDFRLLSGNAVERVRLPRFGGTIPVPWSLRAPSIDPNFSNSESHETPPEGYGVISGSVAELRFSVYYKNQLLQSFRLRAVVGAGSALDKEGRRVLIECDFSQTRRFGDLESLPRRVISLGLNRNAAGTHQLTLKRNDEKAEISWTEGQMSRYTEDVRKELAAHMGVFQFDSDTLESSSNPGSQASAFLGFATRGAALHVQMVSRNPFARRLLENLKNEDGTTLQIIRHDPAYAFPWPLVYDFKLPANSPGSAPVICYGRKSDGTRCDCHLADPAEGLCLRGFWGTRMVIEQLYGDVPPLDDVIGRIAGHTTNPAGQVVVALQGDAHLDTWAKSLATQHPDLHLQTPVPEALLKWLQPDDQRPALVIVISHHFNQGTEDLPMPEMLGPDDKSFLNLDDFTSMLPIPPAPAPWEKGPRSLILLLACGVGGERVDTGTSIAASFLQLGAVGVLATECTIYTGIAARMARDLASALTRGDEVGEALRSTISQLAATGCPLGLAFTYLGPAEARLPK